MHPLLSRSWLLKHTFALLVLIMMIRLGFWQLDRLAQRRELNAATAAALAQTPVALTGGESDAAALHFRKVRVTGTFDNERSVVLRNQQLGGLSGVHLLTPLAISGTDRAVMVDRGWLPEDQNQPSAWAPYAVAGEVTLEGIALRSQFRPDNPLAPIDLPLPGASRITAWMRVDLPKLQEQLPYPLLPLYVQQAPGAGAAVPGHLDHAGPVPQSELPRPVSVADLDEGPHLSYAIQWFLFSAILVVVYTALMRQELRRYAGDGAGVRSQESGVRSQEPGARSQEAGTGSDSA